MATVQWVYTQLARARSRVSHALTKSGMGSPLTMAERHQGKRKEYNLQLNKLLDHYEDDSELDAFLVERGLAALTKDAWASQLLVGIKSREQPSIPFWQEALRMIELVSMLPQIELIIPELKTLTPSSPQLVIHYPKGASFDDPDALAATIASWRAMFLRTGAIFGDTGSYRLVSVSTGSLDFIIELAIQHQEKLLELTKSLFVLLAAVVQFKSAGLMLRKAERDAAEPNEDSSDAVVETVNKAPALVDRDLSNEQAQHVKDAARRIVRLHQRGGAIRLIGGEEDHPLRSKERELLEARRQKFLPLVQDLKLLPPPEEEQEDL